MRPVLFTIPGIDFDVPSYGFMMMVGFLSAIMWAARRAQKSGGNPDVLLNCGFIALICGVIGARFMYVVHYWDKFAMHTSAVDMIVAIVNVRRGGLEFYGGFIGALLGVLFYLVLWRHSVRWYLDIIAPSAMLGLAFGRIGCFLNGCCWGGVCELPWAVEFPYASPPLVSQWSRHVPEAALPAELIFTLPDGMPVPISRESMAAAPVEVAAAAEAEQAARARLAELQARAEASPSPELAREVRLAEERLARARAKLADVRAQLTKFDLTLEELQAKASQYHSAPVHPAQLYAAIAAGLLALFLDRLYWVRRRDGQVVCALLLAQPLARYLLEVIRADNPSDTLGFTISQAIALGLTTVGTIGLILLRGLPPRSPQAVVFDPALEEAAKQAAKAAAKPG